MHCHYKQSIYFYLLRKVASRLYLLRKFKHAKPDPGELLRFHMICIHPMAEYVCQVFHDSLPAYLCNELERLQKCASRIIYPYLDYSEALVRSGLTTLHSRRQVLTKSIFDDIVSIKAQKLHKLLPACNKTTISLRSKRHVMVLVCKTSRYQSSFIVHNAREYTP